MKVPVAEAPPRSIHKLERPSWRAAQGRKSRPVPTPAAPLVISASELLSWLRCRVQHHWSYQVRLRLADTPERLAVGTLGHEVIEHFYKKPRAERTVAYMQRLVKRHVHRSSVDAVSTESRTLLAAMLPGYAKWVQTPRVCEYTDKEIGLDRCFPELEFNVPLTADGSIRVKGKLDGVFKSTTQRHTIGIIETKFLKDIRINDLENRLQLSMYLWALTKLFPKARHFLAYYQILRKMAPSPRVKSPLFHRELVERTPDELHLWEKDVEHMMMDMNGGGVYPSPMDSCQWSCDYLIPCGLRSAPADLKHVLDTMFVTRPEDEHYTTMNPSNRT